MQPVPETLHASSATRGSKPSSRFAFAFDEPRIRVIISTPTSPIANRASQAGTWRGGLAPRTSAR